MYTQLTPPVFRTWRKRDANSVLSRFAQMKIRRQWSPEQLIKQGFFPPYFCFDTHSLSHFAKNMHICIDHLHLRLWVEEEEAGRGVSAQLE